MIPAIIYILPAIVYQFPAITAQWNQPPYTWNTNTPTAQNTAPNQNTWSSSNSPPATQYQQGYTQGGAYQSSQPVYTPGTTAQYSATPEELYNVTTEVPTETPAPPSPPPQEQHGDGRPNDVVEATLISQSGQTTDAPTETPPPPAPPPQEQHGDGRPNDVVAATLISQSAQTTEGPSQADLAQQREFEKTILDEINKYRLMHGAAPATLSADLSKKAKDWAEKMAKAKHESINVDSPYGQLTFSTKTPVPNAAIASVRHWYNRVKNYAWDKPEITTKSMQFTQLVWAASQQIGVGEASMDDVSYVVALFNPVGNKKKDLMKNVLQVSGSDDTKRGPDSCPSGWHKFKKNCYRYFNNQVKWSEAVNLCDDEHSSLTSLESVEEEVSVRSIIANDEGTNAWVGLSDRVNPESKEMIWVDGNSVKYENWNQAQEDDSTGPKCTTLSTASEGWMYRNCQSAYGFICKRRLKDILSYMVVLSYPQKMWSDNLRSEGSPRYMAMKKHLDQAIMNLYNDDDWFVDMLFEGFSPSEDDKVSAQFKLRFSPDGDAPSNPLDKLRTKLESSGFISGENLILSNVSLQNGE